MIIELLNQMAEIKYQVDLLNLDKRSALDSILTEAQRTQIREIEFEFAQKTEAANANYAELEAKVKPLVIDEGKSVKGDGLQAVYVKGRVVWDAKALDGYAISNPALFAFRMEGEPSVSIRAVK